MLLLNVRLDVASLVGDVSTVLKRFLGVFLGLARILWGLEGVGVCVLLEDDRVNLTVCSVSSAVSKFSTKGNYINEFFYHSMENYLPLRGDIAGPWTLSSKSFDK